MSCREMMRRFVDLLPDDDDFDEATEQFRAAAERKEPPLGDLLLALDPVRRRVEARAVKAGLPDAWLGAGRPFEENVPAWVPKFLRQTSPDVLDRTSPAAEKRRLFSLATFVSNRHKDTLTWQRKREHQRADRASQYAVPDPRSHVEYARASNTGELTTHVAAPIDAAWIPSVQEHLTSAAVFDELRYNLREDDLEIADFYMSGFGQHGEGNEIARHLGISPSSITAAKKRIARIMEAHGLGPGPVRPRRR